MSCHPRDWDGPGLGEAWDADRGREQGSWPWKARHSSQNNPGLVAPPWCGTGRVPELALNDTLEMKVKGCLGLLIPRQNKDPFLLFPSFSLGFSALEGLQL